MKTKRGFTLVELVVALGVVAVVMSLVMLALISANKFSQTKQQVANEMQEVQSFKTSFEQALEEFQTSNWQISNSQTNFVEFENVGSGENKTISFQHQTLWLNEENCATFELLTDVNFETNDNLIKCNLSFSDSNKTLIFNKRI